MMVQTHLLISSAKLYQDHFLNARKYCWLMSDKSMYCKYYICHLVVRFLSDLLLLGKGDSMPVRHVVVVVVIHLTAKKS